MKHSFTLLTLFLCMLFNLSKAAETEPNSTKAGANTLALNGSNTGSLSPVGDVDWWKITTTSNGRLDITLTPTLGKYVWVYVYANDGTTQLKSQNAASTFTTSADGLAAGTYYIKVVCYYPSETTGYNISNKLVLPAQGNDAEPNDTKAQAIVLPLNSSVTGHTGYFNTITNARDTFDWYKVTTNADGRLRLRLTSGNGTFVWAYLYDNDGVSQLNAEYTNGTTDINTDGLAAGTYYVRVKTYYNGEFAPYKLEDSLYKPAQDNDKEPNATRAQAIALPLNSSKTGHIGYRYKNVRDTFDWYKITTNEDGALKLKLTPANGQYTYIYLYDNDGTTLLKSTYGDAPFIQITDGLAPGTYYVRINCYYTSDFAPYKLEDSLLTYKPTDAESNAKPYLAKTLLANTANSGHTCFYYNKVRDTLDWWKINYTGTGALSVKLNLETPKVGEATYTWLEVYKDTNATALFSQYTTSSITASFTKLAQGYYYVRVRTYYSSEFQAYTLNPTFTQKNIAKLQLTGSVNAPDCSSTNKLTLKCSGSKSPYRVQLYRYGVLYRSMVVNNTAAFSFDALPPGVYSVNAYGDGATGIAFTTVNATFVPVPATLTVSNIKPTAAKLNWNTQSCVKYYQVQYRKAGTTAWTTKQTKGNTSFLNITGLTAGTRYEWHVAPADSANGTSGLAPYSALSTFTTATSLIAEKMATPSITDEGTNAAITTYPNPANTQFTIQLSGSNMQGFASLWLRDMNGSIVWSKQQVQVDALKGMQVDVSKFAPGMYMLQIVDGDNEVITVKKIIISR